METARKSMKISPKSWQNASESSSGRSLKTFTPLTEAIRVTPAAALAERSRANQVWFRPTSSE